MDTVACKCVKCRKNCVNGKSVTLKHLWLVVLTAADTNRCAQQQIFTIFLLPLTRIRFFSISLSLHGTRSRYYVIIAHMFFAYRICSLLRKLYATFEVSACAFHVSFKRSVFSSLLWLHLLNWPFHLSICVRCDIKMNNNSLDLINYCGHRVDNCHSSIDQEI